VTVVVHSDVVVVFALVIASITVAVEASYEFPRPAFIVIVIVDEKDAPGFKEGGMGPLVAVNPFPTCTTVTPSVESSKGRLPMFFTVYETITLSPGRKGPTLKVAA